MASLAAPSFVAPSFRPVQPVDFGEIFMRPLQIAQQIEAARRQNIAAEIAQQMAPFQVETARNQALRSALELQALQEAPQRAAQAEALQTLGAAARETGGAIPISIPEQEALADFTQVGRPVAISEMQQTGLEEGGVRPTPVSADIVRGTGLPGVGVSEQAVQRAVERARALRPSTAPGVRYMTTDQGIVALPTRPIGDEITPTVITGPTGEPLRAAPRPSAATRGLTEFQQTSYLTRASKAGVDTNNFLNADTGEIDYKRLAVEVGRREGQAAETERQAKVQRAAQLPAALKERLAGYNAASRDLESLKNEIASIEASGAQPSAFDNAIAAATAAPPDGFFGSLYQQSLRFFQSPESKDLEAQKGKVSSALLRAVSGLAVTESERRNTTPFLPVAGDSYGDLIRKVAGLEEYIKNQSQGILEVGGQTPIAPSTAVPTTSTTTPAPTPLNIRSIRRRQ